MTYDHHDHQIRNIKRTVWFWGVLLGLINFCGSGFQQWGISLTSASKCAFIAGFDLFLTPVFSLFVPTFKHNAKVGARLRPYPPPHYRHYYTPSNPLNIHATITSTTHGRRTSLILFVSRCSV